MVQQGSLVAEDSNMFTATLHFTLVKMGCILIPDCFVLIVLYREGSKVECGQVGKSSYPSGSMYTCKPYPEFGISELRLVL